RPRSGVGAGVAHPSVRVEALERRHLPSRDTQRAVDEAALDVGDVEKDLAQAPLLRRVAVMRALLADAAKERITLAGGELEGRDGVVPLDETDVAPVVRGVLGG